MVCTDLQKEDISLLPMDKIRLVWRGSEALDKSFLELPDTWMSNTHKQRIVSFDLTCWNKTACLEVIEILREMPELLSGIELEYIASAQRASQKHVAVSGTQFMSSSLFAKLANMPGAAGNVRYVNSNDLRVIASQVASSIVATVISDFDYKAQADEVSVTDIIENFLAQQRISTKEFDKTKWESVFWNPDFARPDKVTSLLNDAFEKDATDADKLKVSDTTEKAELGLGQSLDLIGLKGDQTSVAKETITEKLENLWERKSHVEYNGLAFVLKPMVLHRLNLALFNTSNSVTFTDVKLRP